MITAIQFPLPYILHFEVPIPDGQASTVGNFQSAKILGFLIINIVSRITHTHTFCLSAFLCITLCVSLSVHPSARPPGLPSLQPPTCLVLHHPSLPTSTEQLWIHMSVSLPDSKRYRQVHLLEFLSLDRFCCCRPYLHLDTFGWQSIFSHQGNRAQSVLVRSRRIHAIAVFRIDFLTVARELNLSAVGTSWSSNHRTQGNFFS